MAGVVLIFAIHTWHFGRFYFDGEVQHPDWSLSWNDAMYDAADWMGDNLPDDAVVGVWNAGVMGYFATQSIVNLDGLINDFEYRDYLAEDRVHDYVMHRGIDYIADLEPTIIQYGLPERLELTEVYSRPNRATKRDYKIYRVERRAEPAAFAPAGTGSTR
jgi:hypothetical protein